MNLSSGINQVEKVLKYIKEELYTGHFQPGERLPSERRLAEKLDVSRVHVRTALQKLEFYGVVQIYPQSGAVVAQKKLHILERLITDVLQIEQYDFASLVYVRVLLELEAVRLCARNRTDEDLAEIEQAQAEFEANIDTDERVAKDFAFHQAIARGSHNPVISSLLLVITPDIMRYYARHRICETSQEDVIFEHCELLRCIREQDGQGGTEMLRRHLQMLQQFVETNNDENHFFK